ncbi:MAG: DUF4810 domain-containing protein [Bacteroidales bacterium]|nr:DUF4810 domain-containing protein [Bacteroidales bacterium]
MRKLILAALSLIVLSSCGVTNPDLYYWGGKQSGATAYEVRAYRSYDKQTPKSLCDLVAVYEKIIEHPGGTRQVPPPGICAEYGYLLLRPETATTFLENATDAQRQLFGSTDYTVLFRERGKEMLQREVELYPESATFILPLIKKLAD